MFARVLIANRGEIARRIARTCRQLGIACVAVYSDADAGEPHVREADTAVPIGPSPAADSYLNIDRLVAAALATGADAVHPGYGFLSESAAFATAVRDAGLTFIGPSPEVIALMGDKAAAKRRLEAAGVPVVPGTHAHDLDDDGLLAAGAQLGAPLLVKAVAGGGGKGMRTVHDLSVLPDAIVTARREAVAAFGDARVILERLVAAPRHVEVQVFGDHHGQVVHMFERECSVQRRHQKVVEETPSPVVDDALRTRLGDTAVAATSAVGYEGAGTVEFLLDGTTTDTQRPVFYFLEMNTRLQVEHPVTELVTGLDLVEWQLRVAAGEPLPLGQDAITSQGHALEVRLYAEDPVAQLPQTGPVVRVHIPTAHDVRADLGIAQGSTVSRYYDPMLGKLIVHSPDRATACQRMRWLLEHTTVHGVVTNLDLLAAIVTHPAFLAGELTTGFLADHLADFAPPPTPDEAWLAAAVALLDAGDRPPKPGDPHTPWGTLGPFRPGRVGGWQLTLDNGHREATLTITARAGDRFVSFDGRNRRVRALSPLAADGTLRLDIDGVEQLVRASFVRDDDGTAVWVQAAGQTVRLRVVPATRHLSAASLAGGDTFASPMPGAVLTVGVAAGEHVAAGRCLVVVEAMKMEHPVIAQTAGTVTAVHVEPGDPVDAGTVLVAFDPDPPTEAASAASTPHGS